MHQFIWQNNQPMPQDVFLELLTKTASQIEA